MMIGLLKLSKNIEFILMNIPNIINDFENLYGKIDENNNIYFIKKNKINKSLKEIAEKYVFKISEGYRKIVRKFWYKGSALEERCFIKCNCETGWTNNHKKCYKCGSEEYTKEHILNKYPVFELWRNRTRKKIGCNNIRLWLDKNIFKHRIKQ